MKVKVPALMLTHLQVRVGELVEARATLRQQLEGQEAAAVEEQVAAKAELNQLQVGTIARVLLGRESI